MIQFFDQCFRLSQIFRIKPRGEPAVDLRQHVVGLVVLALQPPQPSEVHRGAEFQGFGLLLASDVPSFQKISLGFCLEVRGRQFLIFALCPFD